jgi:mannose-1-phosphate guanylyltransferase
MIQSTVARLGDLVPSSHLLVVTSRQLVPAIRKQLPRLAAHAILGEPCPRDTAPCIGLAAAWVCRQDQEGTMLVLPSDHVITPDNVFREAVAAATEFVEENPQTLMTFGIRPTYPAESFGYIQRGSPLSTGAVNAFRVTRFHEKPSANLAQQYLDAGTFYWNSGIFVWKARTILDELGRHQPRMLRHIYAIADAIGTPHFDSIFESEFAAIQRTSIDYAVMEKAADVAVTEAPFQWDDVGSWQALQRLLRTDADGNTIVGKCVAIDTQGTIIRGDQQHLIATVGLRDCIVVHTPNATLVASKHHEESIRRIVKALEEKGWQDYL